ncbi:MAG: hypothetical protein A2511_06975 [Deltaproteobacteria bacterium RIFOXYD12_FULL_50_9]|nr:MAG: hypothetical protein A2511_06975 [Deltaproteobacteria bacterium RIFOXYD12_FULL_50_9]
MLLAIAFDLSEAPGDAGGDLTKILGVWQEQCGVSVMWKEDGELQVELGRADSLAVLQDLQALLGSSGIGMTVRFHHDEVETVAPCPMR